MNKIKNISILTAAIVVIAVIVRCAASLFLESVSPLLWVAPVYFWLLYASAIMLFKESGKLLNGFLLFKGVKMLVTMVLIFALAFVYRPHVLEIVLSFLVYYMLLLVAESSMLLFIRKRGVK